jgi:hypothetical protein
MLGPRVIVDSIVFNRLISKPSLLGGLATLYMC